MVMPPAASALAVRIVTEGLLGQDLLRDAADSAEIALERREFREIIEQYYRGSEPLEHGVAIAVALALDALGRGDEAIALLERSSERPTDATATLAGRYKRKWLLGGLAADWQRSRDLYLQAYAIAAEAADDEQSMYHAINVAFLEAMHGPAASAVPPMSRDFAAAARRHAQKSKQDHWNAATRAEAELILGDLQSAIGLYELAKSAAPGPRALGSMYGQALHLAKHLYGERGRKAIHDTFDMIDS
jgi:tetratricopeptide (TPR) repeat protein